MFGPHIFHTNNKKIWDFVGSYGSFIPYCPQIKSRNGDMLYSLPFCMSTFYEIWGITDPDKARQKIDSERYTGPIRNLEDQARSLVGETLFQLLIKDYTEKQWGTSCQNLPAFIIKRLPLRFTYNSLYFNDQFIGVPKQGYTSLIQEMIGQVPVLCSIDYLKDKHYWNKQAKLVVYTGCIDEYFDFDLGILQYRTLDFKHETLDTNNFQGNAIINDASKNPWTRKIEHKHFRPVDYDSDKTIVTTETPREWVLGDIPFYPVPTEINTELYKQYENKAKGEKNVLFAGRLGKYKYMDMHVAIENATNLFQTQILPKL
jgi:UDP-galactopyranose mutase